jgi:hypothetical protein
MLRSSLRAGDADGDQRRIRAEAGWLDNNVEMILVVEPVNDEMKKAWKGEDANKALVESKIK